MRITHIVRGDDLLASTPRQIAIHAAMGVAEADLPVYTHTPDILAADGSAAVVVAQGGGHLVVPRPGLPPGGDGQLPRAAGLVAGR